MARIREIMFFLLFVFFLNGATRGKAQLSTLPQKGAAFFPPKMPVPPSGPGSYATFDGLGSDEIDGKALGRWPASAKTLAQTAPTATMPQLWEQEGTERPGE
ncbi:hypothetical protein KY285_024596 [Solanum tuberosum]|nr:hypothetical protein KY285_024596 [Solanum tuberosum]